MTPEEESSDGEGGATDQFPLRRKDGLNADDVALLQAEFADDGDGKGGGEGGACA